MMVQGGDAWLASLGRGGRSPLLAALLPLLATLLLAGPDALATEVSTPPFFAGAEELFDRVEEGEFGSLLEIHLTQYATPPAWQAEWAASRYIRSGLLMEYGSVSSHRLFVNRELALNFSPTERLAVGYERREWEDGRFDLFDERLEARWRAFDGWALVLAGWPTHRKQNASAGVGVRVGGLSGGWLQAVVVDERFIHGQKAGDSERFTRQPVRYLVDGYLERGSFVLYGSLNLGGPYRAVADPENAELPVVWGTAATNYGNLGVELRLSPWSFGALGRFATERLDQGERAADGGTSALSFERRWARGELYGIREEGAWLVSGRVGLAGQRDEFAASGSASGTYTMTTGFFGLEAGYRGWAPLEIRVGYLGSYFRMERRVDAPGPELPPIGAQTDEGYADKVHLKGVYLFRPRMGLQVLISKEVSRSTFGGFGVAAFALF